MNQIKVKWLVVPLLTSLAASAQLTSSPSEITLTATDQHIVAASTGFFSIGENHNAHVKFKYTGVTTIGATPDFIVLIPSSGTTPAGIQIGLNPSVVAQMKPGTTASSLIALFTTVDEPAASSTGIIVHIRVPDEPPPAIQSVVNAASLQPVVSPGAMVSIFGSHLTGPTLSTTFDDTASYPTSVASTTVTFNGIAAPLLYVSPGQINAILPFSLAGQTSLQVAIQRFEKVSNTVTVPLQDTAPAIFTSTQTGTGQGAIRQVSPSGVYSYNSESNPAPAGTPLEIYATGEGLWTPPPQSDVFIFGELFKSQPLSLTIGGQPAKILYAGTIGMYSNWSILQVNAVVPNGLGTGPQPVVLKIGPTDNAQQKVVMWTQ